MCVIRVELRELNAFTAKMDKVVNSPNENAVAVLNIISKVVQDIEQKISLNNVNAKKCEELKLLKEKCCDSKTIVSLNALHGIEHLVKKRNLSGSQAVSMLVSLLPSIHHYGALASTIGNILLLDFKTQIFEKGKYEDPFSNEFQHPFIIILKYNWEKSWFEIYHFVLQLVQMNEDIKLQHKIEFIRPLFRHVFWSSAWQGSKLQLKLFDALLMELNKKDIINFALESLLWQELNIHYCLFLQEFFIYLLKKEPDKVKVALSGMTPTLALAINWLIINGYNPKLWLKILGEALEMDTASGSVVLFLLTDVIMETPSVYIDSLIHVCKSIIFRLYCSKYIAYKFVAVILNWFVSPSFLANSVYKTLEEILDFITEKENKWNDQTLKINDNVYYKTFGCSKKEVKFTVDLILACDCLSEQKLLLADWLKNLAESNEYQMQLKIHSFVFGVLLCESDSNIINLCLDILFKLIDHHKEISFSLLCLLFYKLSRETDPNLQKIFLYSLPKLCVKKENIPLIVGIIESLKRGCQKIMMPLVIQLYLWLWKLDNRTYSYLHKMLHDSSYDFDWELNVSKAIALREICKLAPHLHAKDLVGVLSKILNECSGVVSGLPSAIAIEAVTELCKAYVIDVVGTWNAIQPKLRFDKRPKVIISLCKFFGEVPNLNSSESKKEELMKDVVPMLWNYTFLKDAEIVKNAFSALSNFPLESLPLNLFPEIYRVNIKIPKNPDKNSKTPEDILNLSYVPADFWIQFIEKIEEKHFQDGGQLIIALIEREFTSLPRKFFCHPPEKAEPLSYSYLPSRSICRVLVERLLQHSRGNIAESPDYLKEVIRILSHEYSKLLPPLNWGFMESFMNLDSEFLFHCLAVLAKQGSISPSAKSILENYFKTVEWNSNKLNEILFIYNLLPLLCKSVSYNVLQNFLKTTIEISLKNSLSQNTSHFEKVLQNLREIFINKNVQIGHKNLIAKQLEKALSLIPPEHDVMKMYAICATEFPVKSIEEITSIKKSNGIDNDWLRRAITIRYAIAMRSDIKNPLVWLNEFVEAVALLSKEQNFILNKICFIIRNRRTCDHRVWVQELIWRIQASVAETESWESNKVTLFLVDVFITSVIVLSGCDCLFLNVDEFIADESKKLDIFPQALCVLLFHWNDMLLKVSLWLQKLSKWKHLPQDRVRTFLQALLMLREVKFFKNENEFSCLFNLFPLSSV